MISDRVYAERGYTNLTEIGELSKKVFELIDAFPLLFPRSEMFNSKQIYILVIYKALRPDKRSFNVKMFNIREWRMFVCANFF